jgi:hypothetical protein
VLGSPAIVEFPGEAAGRGEDVVVRPCVSIDDTHHLRVRGKAVIGESRE